MKCNRDKSSLRSVPIRIILALFLLQPMVETAWAAKHSPAEEFVLTNVLQGTAADLYNFSHDERQRGLSKAFLEEILTQAETNSLVKRKGIRIGAAVVSEPLVLRYWNIPCEVAFTNCVFLDDFILFGCHFQARLGIEDSEFHKEVWFEASQFDGYFNSSRAKFLSTNEVWFHTAKMKHNATMAGMVFGGSVNFHFVEIGGFFAASNWNFKDPNASCSLNLLRVAGNADFANDHFPTRVSFDYASFGILKMTACQFPQPPIDASCSFKNTRVQGETLFASNHFPQKVNFDSASFDHWRLTGCAFPKGPELRWLKFAELEVENTRVGSPAKQTRTNVVRSWLNMKDYRYYQSHIPELAFLTAGSNGVQALPALERSLIQNSRADDAEEVFFTQRAYQRQEKSRIAGALDSTLLYHLTGYGRNLLPVVLYSIVFILVGTFVFRQKGSMVRKDKKDTAGAAFDAFFYSLDTFLPGLDLGFASQWVPQKGSRLQWRYRTMHRIVGWIFVPLLVAALVGLVK